MTVEHWFDDTDDGCGSSIVFPEGAAYADTLFEGRRRFCCRINGDSWEDCMRKYHGHMGWEPYVPQGNKNIPPAADADEGTGEAR